MVRYAKEHKEETRQRIIATAGRRLKRDGIDGSGVATLMKDAGLTNGAFYAHFASKDGLVAVAIADQLHARTRTSSRRLSPAVPASNRSCAGTCRPSTGTTPATAAPTPHCSTRSGAARTQPGRRTPTACWLSSTASPPAWHRRSALGPREGAQPAGPDGRDATAFPRPDRPAALRRTPRAGRPQRLDPGGRRARTMTHIPRRRRTRRISQRPHRRTEPGHVPADRLHLPRDIHAADRHLGFTQPESWNNQPDHVGQTRHDMQTPRSRPAAGTRTSTSSSRCTGGSMSLSSSTSGPP